MRMLFKEWLQLYSRHLNSVDKWCKETINELQQVWGCEMRKKGKADVVKHTLTVYDGWVGTKERTENKSLFHWC